MAKLSSTDKPVTKAELAEFYQCIYPFLGGNKVVDGNPIGDVILFDGTTPPAGYLVCDGSEYNISAFPLLAQHYADQYGAANYYGGDGVTTFCVPNHQGEFPRFAGTNGHAGQGNGAKPGVHQDGTKIPSFGYFHQSGTTTPYMYLGDVFDKSTTHTVNIQNKPTNEDKSLAPSSTGKTARFNVDSTYTANNTGQFIPRPTNTSFLACVKYTYVFQEVDYSTTEHVVGTDENGNSLYERVMSTNIGASGAIVTLSPSVNANIVEYYPTVIMSNGEKTTTVPFGNDTIGVVTWITTSGTCGIRTSASSMLGGSIRIRFLYTKTS